MLPTEIVSPAAFEPDPIPRLDAELTAEVARLTAGAEGQSEIELIYRDFPGPVSRRKAILKASAPRIGRSLWPAYKGAIELTAICMAHRVVLEVAYAPRHDWLREGPVAQREINLPILRAERGEPGLPPNGQPEGTW